MLYSRTQKSGDESQLSVVGVAVNRGRRVYIMYAPPPKESDFLLQSRDRRQRRTSLAFRMRGETGPGRGASYKQHPVFPSSEVHMRSCWHLAFHLSLVPALFSPPVGPRSE